MPPSAGAAAPAIVEQITWLEMNKIVYFLESSLAFLLLLGSKRWQEGGQTVSNPSALMSMAHEECMPPRLIQLDSVLFM